MKREYLRAVVRGAYDLQKLRIQMGLRVVANFKAKLGQAPSTKEEDADPEAQDIIKALRASHERITDAIGKVRSPAKNFPGDELISDYAEFVLADGYFKMLDNEKSQFLALKKVVEGFAIWREFLHGVKGVGPAMAGVIISEIDIHRAKYASSIWKYAGLDVGGDGAGRSRRKDHLVEREYTNKSGEQATRVGITFNPWLKTKLVGVLGPAFLKARGDYAEVYGDYKHRLESHAKYGIARDGEVDEECGGKIYKGRRHQMAIRYCVKRFLADLYEAWRKLEGLEVHNPYSEAKLGLKHAG